MLAEHSDGMNSFQRKPELGKYLEGNLIPRLFLAQTLPLNDKIAVLQVQLIEENSISYLRTVLKYNYTLCE